jgi:Domain of unknown function (DUF1816)
MKEFLTNLLNLSGLAWWVEIKTENPVCTYYFGPFVDEKAALTAKSGYIEDLENEGARSIQVIIKRCKQPSQLTVSHDLGGDFSRRVPVLSL